MPESAPIRGCLLCAVLPTVLVNGCENHNQVPSHVSRNVDSASPAPPPQASDGGGRPNVYASVSDGSSGAAAKLYAALPYRGVSLAGAEFAASVGGLFSGTTYGEIPGSYYYPTSDLSKAGGGWPAAANGTAIETDLMIPYFLGKGMNTVRLPLRWEGLQRTISTTSRAVLTGPQVVATFNASELAELQLSMSTLTSAGFTVLIDIHNYAYYTNASEVASNKGGDPLGSANVPDVAFENLWIGLASLYANNPRVVFDLMNEPNTPPDPPGRPAGYTWYSAAQAAVNGIRSIGANNLILVCGNQFGNPGAFTAGGWSDPLKNIQDPRRNFAFEVHEYPDNAYGTGNTCTTGSGGSIQGALNALQTFVNWAKRYDARGFLGEFSAGIDVNADPKCLDAVRQMLAFLQQNATTFIGWTYWAAGAGFGPDNPMNYEFFHRGHDSPQMKMLAPFLQ
jgi:endoglucanase